MHGVAHFCGARAEAGLLAATFLEGVEEADDLGTVLIILNSLPAVGLLTGTHKAGQVMEFAHFSSAETAVKGLGKKKVIAKQR